MNQNNCFAFLEVENYSISCVSMFEHIVSTHSLGEKYSMQYSQYLAA